MSALLFVLAVVALTLRPTARAAALLFVGAAAAHDFVLGDFDGFAYYGSAALADLFVIWGVSRLSEKSEFTRQIQKISVVSIALNAAGYGIWFAYLSPIAYNAVYLLLYSCALLLFVTGGGPGVGIRAVRVRTFGLRGRRGAWRSALYGGSSAP